MLLIFINFFIKKKITNYCEVWFFKQKIKIKMEAFVPALQLESDEDLNRYIRLLGGVPRHVSQVQQLAAGQFERGVVVSAANLTAAIGLVRASIEAPNAGAFAVTDQRLGNFEQPRIDAFRDRIATVVSEQVNPALRELAEFLEGPYMAQAPSGVGISQYPNGREYYRYLTRRNTTMDVTPQEVQRIGYELLAEFREQMAQIQAELGFAGTREEFHLFLRTDARFFPKNPEEVARRLEAASDSMFAHIDDFFINTPQAPYGPAMSNARNGHGLSGADRERVDEPRGQRL